MTLKASFVYKNADSTRDLNARLRRFINRGIVWGGTMVPGVGLTVQVAPLTAVGFDGMTVEEDSSKVLTVVGGGVKQYVVIHARYNEGGVPATPTLAWRVLTQAAYAADPEKDYLIVVGTVTPVGVVVLLSEIDFTERDEVDPLGRDQYRGAVANPAALPTPPPTMNRVGDFYFVNSDHTFYFWTGLIWEPLNTGSYNSETTLMNEQVIRQQRDRIVNGSGVIAGPRPTPAGDFSSQTEINILETPSIADQVGIDTFSALVNGHYCEVRAQEVVLSPKPAVPGSRLDLIFLEVWREAAVVPETHVYEANRVPAPSPPATTLTLQQVDALAETAQWAAGMAVAAQNTDLDAVSATTHTWAVVRHRLTYVSSVAAAALYNPCSAAVLALTTNIDGNPFTAPPGAGADLRMWMAPAAASSVDGVSWAIPLLVVRRQFAENPGGGDGIKVFRSGVRHIMPVYPVCDLDNVAKLAIDSIHRADQAAYGTHWPTSVEPSGFITGLDVPVDHGIVANTIKFFDYGAKVRVRGYEDYFTLPSSDIQIGSPPAFGYARQLVYLEMTVTLYDDDPSSKPNCMTSQVHHPYIPSSLFSAVQGQGWKRGFVQYEVKVETPAAPSPVTDEDDAMAGAGWTRGDLSLPAAQRFEDGGIWSKTIVVDADDRIHPYLTKWAIPIALIHRRNTTAYNVNTNPNGTGISRPDSRQDPNVAHRDDLISLRRKVGISEDDLKEELEQNMDLLMKGQLRTKFADKFIGSGTGGTVGGSRILQADSIGAVPGAYQIGIGDGMRRIWSDAREFHIVAYSFNIHASTTNPYLDYTYVMPNFGILTLKAPAGAHIVRMGLPVSYVDGNPASGSFMDFFGPPLFTTRLLRDIANNPALGLNGQPSPAWAKVIDVNFADQPMVYWDPIGAVPIAGCPWLTATTDSAGHATSMTTTIATAGMFAAGGTVVVSWWVHYDRSFVAGGNSYNANFGLAEIPDVVHKVVKDPAGANETINVGAIYTAVRKSVVGAASVTFTAADITAANPSVPGVVTIVGFDFDSLAFSTTSPGYSSGTMNVAQTEITINFAAPPYTGDVEIVIAYYTTNVSKWVEIGRGGKSVQALYSWYCSPEIDLFSPPPFISNNLAVQLGAGIWTVPQIDGKHVSYLAPQIWTRAANGPAVPWILVPSPYLSPGGIGYCYSNMLSMNPNAITGLLRYVKVTVALHSVLGSAAADALLIHYTYTPYQGKSNRSGETPVTIGAGSVVPTLRKMLQGTIESNTDFYVTQSGAASYFSGVLGMTGLPVNHMVPYQTSTFLANSSRFADYNMTYLVKDKTNFYTNGLRSNYKGAEYLNAAAILRLPYPQTISMVSGADYHVGVMDWDLDPARAGVNAGVFSYAPGYFGPPLVDMRQAKLSQFVNGLTPLSARGYAKREDLSFVISPDQWETNESIVGGTGGTIKLYLENAWADGFYWATFPSAPSDSYFKASAGIRNTGGALVARTMAQFVTDKELEKVAGLHLYSPSRNALLFEQATLPFGGYYRFPANLLITDSIIANASVAWTYVPGFSPLAPRITILCNCPGEILAWYQSAEKFVTPIVHITSRPLTPTPFLLGDASVLMESCPEENFSKNGGPLFGNIDWLYESNKFIDVVKLPLSSYSKQQSTLDRNMSQGMLSLKGKEVAYPASWAAGDITVVEDSFIGGQDLRGAGRGVYFGTSTRRLNMPVFLPGTGTPLSEALRVWPKMMSTTACAPPEGFPVMPGESFFKGSNQVSYPFDHGGPIAYVCMGSFIRPSSDEYKNRLVFQVSGGPTGPDKLPEYPVVSPSWRVHTPTDVDGTAIDAFWPKNRPILRAK